MTENDDETNVAETLSGPQETWCQAYEDTELNSETRGNASASARLAGYKSPGAAGFKMKHNPRIQRRLAELQKEHRLAAGISVDKVLTDLDRQRQMAEAKGDISAAIRASELQGRHLAMFTDRSVVEEPQEVEHLDERRTEEARRIAQIRLRDCG